MEYIIAKLAKISGVSTRTLRFYDEIGLLKPARWTQGGYRVYADKEVDLLQQILFFRELDMPLGVIRDILHSDDFSDIQALAGHLSNLEDKRARLDKLITNVKKTLRQRRGKTTMSDKEKFEGFKQELIARNEKKYGKEIREKYGDKEVDSSNQKLAGQSQEQYDLAQELSSQINALLKQAMKTGDPAGEPAQAACEKHAQWLRLYWKEYSKETHKALGDMYVSDPRFTAYYDAVVPGSATLLRDALYIYCEE